MESNMPMDDQDRMLSGLLYRLDCPSAQELGDYNLGLAVPARATAVEAHLLSCARCVDELQELRRFLAADEAMSPEHPTQGTHGLRRLLNDIIARILPPQASFAGCEDNVRYVRAKAGNALFVVGREQLEDGSFVVSGRIMAEDMTPWQNTVIQVRAEGRMLGIAMVSTNGTWTYASLAQPACDLRVVPATGAAVVIPVPEELPV